MRELTDEEVEQVDGGFAPIIGAVIAAVGHFTARSALTSFAGRVGAIMATYEIAKWAHK
jgi:lactobin A/cerein 7B family class IIb bacteriocin